MNICPITINEIAIMTNQTVKSDFLHQTIEEEAWKEVSEEFPWTEALLEKFQNEVNWNRISYNNNIIWTTSMLEQFKSRINWNVFSYCTNKTVFTPENLEIYKDYWDWNCLSDSQGIEFNYEIIDKFVNKWNWKNSSTIIMPANVSLSTNSSSTTTINMSPFYFCMNPVCGIASSNNEPKS